MGPDAACGAAAAGGRKAFTVNVDADMTVSGLDWMNIAPPKELELELTNVQPSTTRPPDGTSAANTAPARPAAVLAWGVCGRAAPKRMSGMELAACNSARVRWQAACMTHIQQVQSAGRALARKGALEDCIIILDRRLAPSGRQRARGQPTRNAEVVNAILAPWMTATAPPYTVLPDPASTRLPCESWVAV